MAVERIQGRHNHTLSEIGLDHRPQDIRYDVGCPGCDDERNTPVSPEPCGVANLLEPRTAAARAAYRKAIDAQPNTTVSPFVRRARAGELPAKITR